MQIPITSDQTLVNINQCFRVLAGPGAGKTHWLIQHIKSVVNNTTTLSSVSRIACISYTNVAADEILDRLGSLKEYVEVSTIHGFLYKYVVKPYIHLVQDDEGKFLVNFPEMDGHDDYTPHYGKVRPWLSGIRSAKGKDYTWYIADNEKKLYDFLSDLRWIFDAEGVLKLDTDKTYLKAEIPKDIRSNVVKYRMDYWQNGELFHDDVLYFAYRILDANPSLRGFISAKFPYMFIDEFQDTNPIQTRIVQWLAQTGTIVGVVGDSEQSIYAFQGARQEDFQNFVLPGISHENYVINGNRRSTKRIVDLLNRLRGDGLKQASLRNVEGDNVEVHVGDHTKSVPHILNSTNNNLFILARKNADLIAFRKLDNSKDLKPWADFVQADSNNRRVKFIEKIAAAAELLRLDEYASSVRMMLMAYPKRIRDPLKSNAQDVPLSEIERRALAMTTLEFFANNHDKLRNQTILNVYNQLSEIVKLCVPRISLQGYGPGKGKVFVESTQFGELLDFVSISEDIRRIRTIHKAKGLEFQNVAVSIDKSLLQKITKSNNNDEDKRILYVALSRAIERLFILIQDLHPDDEAILNSLGLSVHRH